MVEENIRADEGLDKDRLGDEAETTRVEEGELSRATLARSGESKSFTRRLRSTILSAKYGVQQFDVLVSHNPFSRILSPLIVIYSYSSTKIIQQTHLSSPATFALLIAISNFICTLLALRLIDHTGRRKLLLRGLTGMLAGMIVLSISFIFIPRSKAIESMIQEAGAKAGAPAIISLIGMTVFCCCYALSIGNIPWVVQSEVSSLTPLFSAVLHSR